MPSFKSAIHRRQLLQAAAALGTGWLLPGAHACEFMTSTLRVTHPFTRATAPDATTAVVCMKFDEVAEADRLVMVASPVATGAEMGGPAGGGAVDFAIPAGQESWLDERGHFVRLTGLKFALEVGRSYPLLLGFEKGGTYNATLSVDYPRFT